MAVEEPAPIELVESRRKPGKVDVRVGRRVAATLLPASVTALGLRSGAAWTPDLASQVEHRISLERAHQVASDALARRPMTAREVRDRLERRGFTAAAIDQTLTGLAQVGLINDAEVARRLVEETARAGAGAALLESKLAAKGVDADTARRVVDEAATPNAALDAARRRAESLPDNLSPTVKARRLFGFLARRGFDEHESAEAVRTVLGIEVDSADAEE